MICDNPAALGELLKILALATISEEYRQIRDKMILDAFAAWKEEYSESTPEQQGVMIGQLIGSTIEMAVGVGAATKGLKTLVKTGGLKTTFVATARLSKRIINIMVKTPEAIFELVKTVVRKGDRVILTTVENTTITCRIVDLEAEMAKLGHLDEAGVKAALQHLLTNCFTGDTLVHTDQGVKRIDAVQVGDRVLSKDVTTGEIAYKTVQTVYVKSAIDFIHLKFADETIKTTPSHLFFTNSGWWVSAKNLKPGDKIQTQNGIMKPLIATETIQALDDTPIYNLNVADFHTYFVGESGVLVHNDCSEIKTALIAKRIAANRFFSAYLDRIRYAPADASTIGKWLASEGQEAIRGECKFISNNSEVNAILKNHGLDGIEYADGIPDFSRVVATRNGVRAELSIENMSTSRYTNYSAADKALADKWGMTKLDVESWRVENGFTWHELNDTVSMQLIPTKVNGEFKHIGGVGELKSKLKLGGDLSD